MLIPKATEWIRAAKHLGLSNVVSPAFLGYSPLPDNLHSSDLKAPVGGIEPTCSTMGNVRGASKD